MHLPLLQLLGVARRSSPMLFVCGSVPLLHASTVNHMMVQDIARWQREPGRCPQPVKSIDVLSAFSVRCVVRHFPMHLRHANPRPGLSLDSLREFNAGDSITDQSSSTLEPSKMHKLRLCGRWLPRRRPAKVGIGENTTATELKLSARTAALNQISTHFE